MANAKKDFKVTYVESAYAAAALICSGFDCQTYNVEDNYEQPTYYVFVKTPEVMKALKRYKEGKLQVDAMQYAKEHRDINRREWTLATRYREFMKAVKA